MSKDILNRHSVNSIDAKLMNFLIEKTKNAKLPICCTNLAGLAKYTFGASVKITTMEERIRDIRSKILYLEDLDTETKVKLLFVLSVSVDKATIQSKIRGTFRFDEKHRITYYKSVDGNLELKGDHTPIRKERIVSFRQLIEIYLAHRGEPSNQNLSNRNVMKQETEKFVDLIFEKCKNISSPLFCLQLFAEFDALNGLKMSPYAFTQRIIVYCEVIQKVRDLDTTTKVRQLFALSASLTENCLTKLQQNALVRVDERKRIIEYKSNDGSLHLQGKHDCYSKRFISGNGRITSEGSFMQLPTQAHSENLEEGPEKEKELSDDSDHEFDSNRQENTSNDDSNSHDFQSTSTPRTVFPEHSLKATNSEKNSSVFNINTTRKTNNKRKFDKRNADDHKHPKKSIRAEPNAPLSDDKLRTEDYDPNPSSVHSNSVMNGGGNFQVPRRVDALESDYVELEEDFEKEEDLSNDSDDGIDSSIPLSRKQRRPDNDEFSDDSGTLDFQSTSSPRMARRSSKITGSKRTPSIPKINTPRETSNKRKAAESNTDTQKRARKSNNAESNVPLSGDFRTDDLENYEPNHSSVHSSSERNNEGNGEMRDEQDHLDQNQDARQNSVNRTVDASNVPETSENPRPIVVVNDREEARLDGEQVKVGVFRGALQNEANTIGDGDDDDIQEIPPPPKRVNEVPPKDDGEVKKTNAFENPRPVVPLKQEPYELVEVKKEATTEEGDDVKPTLTTNRAPILQILQGLHTLLVLLYHPSLETLQKEIEERMKRFEGLGTSIPIVQIVWTMELCFSKMTETSVRISSEGAQFIDLRDFLCYSKSFILNLKIEELKSVMDKINEYMQGCQNKRVRVKKVEEILRVTLDNITI